MTNNLRRKSDKREIWAEEKRELETSLIIPPCDLWHDAGEQGANSVKAKGDADTPVQSEQSFPGSKVPQDVGSQCWAFMGATGGVGTTSLAVQFAYELSKQIDQFGRGSYKSSQPLVCIIDLDFEAGRVAQYLDIKPGISHEDLMKEASLIDAAYAQSLFVERNNNISLLAAPNKIRGNQDINPAVVISLLEIACDMFPYVILDVPQHWQDWTLAAIGGSDFFGLVSDLTIPSLNAAREKRAQIAQIFNNEKSCEYLLNKYERRYLKSSIRLPDAKKALKSDVFGTVCFEPEAAIDAVNCGAPIGSVRSGSRISKDCESLLDKILELTHDKNIQMDSALAQG